MGLQGLLVASLALVTVLVSGNHTMCTFPPPWTIDGQDIMAAHRGNVTLATELENLHKELLEEGLTDLSFLIVNSKLWHAQLTYQMLEKRVTFPVYQETFTEQVWNKLQGGKDDMFVYDRCGRLINFIPFPKSIVSNQLVSSSISYAYFDDPCGPCPQILEAEVDTTDKSEEINNTLTSVPFNSSSQCNFNLEQCNAVLSNSQLSHCCLDYTEREKSVQCANVTRRGCLQFRSAKHCCSEIKDEVCKQHNESSCSQLLEDQEIDKCCDQMSEKNTTTSYECVNISSSFCNELKDERLCCDTFFKSFLKKSDPKQYNYSCSDYDAIKCASLDEQKLVRCCVNSENFTEEVEDVNYEGVCQNVTKMPCNSITFALDCCKQINEESIKFENESSPTTNETGHHKHHHHGHHNIKPTQAPTDTHKITEEYHYEAHKHRHHHGEVLHNPTNSTNSTSYHHNHEQANKFCRDFPQVTCNKHKIQIKRYQRCCLISNPSNHKCRSILHRCDELALQYRCCLQYFQNENELTNSEHTISENSESSPNNVSK